MIWEDLGATCALGYATISLTKAMGALELVGTKTLLDTMQVVKPGSQACVCCTGILGGVYDLDFFDSIKDIPNGVYLTGLTTFLGLSQRKNKAENRQGL